MIKATSKNKIILYIVVATLFLLVGIVGVNGESQEDVYIKVGLYYGSSGQEVSTFICEEGFLLMRQEANDLILVKSLEKYTTLVSSFENGTVVLRDSNGVKLSNDLAKDSVLISAAQDKEERYIYINGSLYRDGISVLAGSNSTLTIINVVTLEHYIKGVLNSEMSYAYPIEALKAQAISARSYAIDNLEKHTKYGFDLCADINCQVYKGVAEEHEETSYACDATSGLVMVYESQVVSGYYFASSGGYTQNSEDVWYSSLGYLRAVKDDFSPIYSWNTSITFEELKTKLEKSGYEPGLIKSVYIGSRNETGSVAELIIEGNSQTISLNKDAIRTTLGTSLLKSLRFSMGSSEKPEIITIGGPSGLSIWSANGISSMTGSINILSSGGQSNDMLSNVVNIFDGNNIVIADNMQANLTSFTEEKVSTGTVYFNGLGYGHGVGLPQTSARVMANQGYGYEDILNYYYTDIRIEHHWDVSY